MKRSLIVAVGVVAVILAVTLLVKLIPAQGVAKAGAVAANKTSWGEPDLQGIWTDELQTPMQRPTQYADKEFFTEEERAKLDTDRAFLLRRDKRVEKGSERDVAGAYNSVFQSIRHTGKRTSLIVDPPDGRIPALTEEAKRKNEADRQFRLALLQATATCKNKEAACNGGTYGPPSPRRAELPATYNTGRLNRADGPEDRAMSERCMGAVLPDFTGYRRIVQAPGTVSIFYDVGQGQGWQRIIPVTGNPHVPESIRERFGDSRGHWEGNTLVVDVTNFSFKSDYQGARDHLHLIERWTRTAANTLDYAVTIEDPTVWTKPWTVKQEMKLQNEQANRIYYEPRCHEGNYGLPGLLVGMRTEEKLYSKGLGPDPATKDTATDFGSEGGVDVLQGGGGGV
jgi:hypothetical protein